MTVSRARLRVEAAGGRSRVFHASATAPQRWAFGEPSCDGWADVCHQLIGDGVFAGDRCVTTINVERGAHTVVRSVAATPVRGPGRGVTITRIRVAPGAAAVHLPGALIPQRSADHTTALRIDADDGARVLAASTIVLGRSGMGERGAFSHLRFRTTARYGDATAYAEEATIRPAAWLCDGPAGFAGAEAALSILVLGDWPPAAPVWWGALATTPGIRGGVARLRVGGIAFRALCRTLGDANELLVAVERTLRAERIRPAGT